MLTQQAIVSATVIKILDERQRKEEKELSGLLQRPAVAREVRKRCMHAP
jgi:hypothetical protein